MLGVRRLSSTGGGRDGGLQDGIAGCIRPSQRAGVCFRASNPATKISAWGRESASAATGSSRWPAARCTAANVTDLIAVDWLVPRYTGYSLARPANVGFWWRQVIRPLNLTGCTQSL